MGKHANLKNVEEARKLQDAGKLEVAGKETKLQAAESAGIFIPFNGKEVKPICEKGDSSIPGQPLKSYCVNLGLTEGCLLIC